MPKFIYPTDTQRVTSGFRVANRKDHNGVDFAQAGTHNTVAVADGVVSRSYRSNSYGEVIFIVHTIDGQVYETVSAHLREGSRKVKEGDQVKQGQLLGLMGNTGQSTGQHLHFELHKGRWNIEKSNAVDPLQYLGKVEAAKKVLCLPASADTWTVYKLDRQPTKSNPANIAGTLRPKKFGGLQYEILGNPFANVYTIQTSNFGKVNIYAAASTGAVIK